jgi:hypothetical protein
MAESSARQRKIWLRKEEPYWPALTLPRSKRLMAKTMREAYHGFDAGKREFL